MFPLLLSTLVLFSSPLCRSSSLLSAPLAPAAAPLRPSSAPRAEVTGLRLRGGGLDYRYTDGWNEVTVRMPIADNIKARDIVYALTPSSLTLGLKGQDPFINAELWDLATRDDSIWEIDQDAKLGRCVTCTIKKAKGAKWDFLLKNEDTEPDLTVTEKCFLDISIDGEPAGRITVGLFGKTVPKTVHNFRALCTGEVAVDPEVHKRSADAGLTALTYKNTTFHRVIPQFMIQGGDFTRGDGTGGESVYGGRFEDESFQIKHSREGLLSMANAGADCNGAQFFITTSSANHLNGKHVVFGEVLDGLELIKKIEECGSNSGKPSKVILMTDVGALPADE